jgi:hypothetical protein
MAAKRACEAEIGVPPTAQPLSESEIKARYDYLVQARECLLDLGYSISDPPSIDEFLDTWATGPWTPYSDLADQTNQQQWENANQRCPQTTPLSTEP